MNRATIIAVGIVSSAMVFAPRPLLAQASEGPSTTRNPEPFIQLVFDRSCADSEHAALFASQLRLRMPDTMVVSGNLETTGEWVVRWERASEGCVLNFASGETTSTMRLAANADAEQIELAASRVAFLASVSSTGGSSDTMPLGTPGEEIDEAELVASNAPVQPQQPPQPPSEPPVEPPPPPPVEELEDDGTSEEPATEEEPVEEEVEDSQEAAPADGDDRPGQPFGRYDRPATLVQPLPGMSLPTTRGKPVAPGMLWGLIGSVTEGVDGIAVSTFFNNQTEMASGIQLASIFNLGGDVEAVQAAGIFNSAERSEGFQLAGIFNHSSRSRGFSFQVAGVTNIHGGDFDGFQIAGVTNIAPQSVDGIVFAGAVNVSGTVDGIQIAPVNVAQDVDGLQIGLVNVAETSNVSIGLVNIIYSEPFWGVAETASDGITLAGMRHGSRYLKWSVWAGSSAIADQPLLLAGIGLGIHVPFEKLYLDVDFIALDATGFRDSGTNAANLELRVSGGYRFFPWLAAYGGVGLRTFFSDGADFGMVPNFAGDLGSVEGSSAGWPFAFVGARF